MRYVPVVPGTPRPPDRRSGRRGAARALILVATGWTVLISAAATAHADARPARKPGLAFLFSMVLPGAGQLYNGDDRGYLYLGLESAAWFARFSYLDAGNRREGQYERYARDHWSFDRYRPPYDTGTPAERDIQTRYGNWTAGNDSVLVHFLETDMQQYYEEIGKYDKYRMGWDDWASTYDPVNDKAQSPHRKHYRKMREQSNDLLDNARLATAALVVNRLVSAVDAFRTARGREGAGSAYRIESGFGGGRSPRAEIRLVRLLP